MYIYTYIHIYTHTPEGKPGSADAVPEIQEPVDLYTYVHMHIYIHIYTHTKGRAWVSSRDAR